MCGFCATVNFNTIGIKIEEGMKYTPYFCIANSTAKKEERYRYCPWCGEKIKYKDETDG